LKQAGLSRHKRLCVFLALALGPGRSSQSKRRTIRRQGCSVQKATQRRLSRSPRQSHDTYARASALSIVAAGESARRFRRCRTSGRIRGAAFPGSRLRSKARQVGSADGLEAVTPISGKSCWPESTVSLMWQVSP